MNRCVLLVAGISICVASIAGESIDDPRVSQILGLDSDLAFGEYLASECSTCHSEDGGNAGIPVIHNKAPEDIVLALLDYRDAVRSNVTMQSIAGALSDEEIGALASYFSGQ